MEAGGVQTDEDRDDHDPGGEPSDAPDQPQRCEQWMRRDARTPRRSGEALVGGVEPGSLVERARRRDVLVVPRGQVSLQRVGDLVLRVLRQKLVHEPLRTGIPGEHRDLHPHRRGVSRPGGETDRLLDQLARLGELPHPRENERAIGEQHRILGLDRQRPEERLVGVGLMAALELAERKDVQEIRVLGSEPQSAPSRLHAFVPPVQPEAPARSYEPVRRLRQRLARCVVERPKGLPRAADPEIVSRERELLIERRQHADPTNSREADKPPLRSIDVRNVGSL